MTCQLTPWPATIKGEERGGRDATKCEDDGGFVGGKQERGGCPREKDGEQVLAHMLGSGLGRHPAAASVASRDAAAAGWVLRGVEVSAKTAPLRSYSPYLYI